ncbi:MAG: hypothetical protein E3K38_15155 [Candidatus Kuenenia stuttgartiensis]|nr:hypothetical protein [Candidatus Kuenenia stuttgartiensis]
MNCEVSTDKKHGLIVNCEAVSQNNDQNQLSSQVEQCTETLGKLPTHVISDSGYFSLKDIEKVPERVKVIIPSRKQAQKENKRTEVKPFGKEEFHYLYLTQPEMLRQAQHMFGNKHVAGQVEMQDFASLLRLSLMV